MAGGSNHSLALRTDGTVWSWGRNQCGQLGDASTLDKHTPVQVQGLTNVIAIASGGSHCLALRNDSTVWTWGNNNEGQLGSSFSIMSTFPVHVSGLDHIVAIAGSANHSLALKSDGTLWVWGENTFGHLGLGDTLNRMVSTQVNSLCTILSVPTKDKEEMSVLIYPNPVTSILTVSTEGEKIKELSVINVIGEILLKEEVNGKERNVDISTLAKGMYLLQVQTEKGVSIKKLIKE